MEKIKNFRELKVWQKGIDIVKDIYIITKMFPKDELYCLSSQMRRSAISIPSKLQRVLKDFIIKNLFNFCLYQTDHAERSGPNPTEHLTSVMLLNQILKIYLNVPTKSYEKQTR